MSEARSRQLFRFLKEQGETSGNNDNYNFLLTRALTLDGLLEYQDSQFDWDFLPLNSSADDSLEYGAPAFITTGSIGDKAPNPNEVLFYQLDSSFCFDMAINSQQLDADMVEQACDYLLFTADEHDDDWFSFYIADRWTSLVCPVTYFPLGSNLVGLILFGKLEIVTLDDSPLSEAICSELSNRNKQQKGICHRCYDSLNHL